MPTLQEINNRIHSIPTPSELESSFNSIKLDIDTTLSQSNNAFHANYYKNHTGRELFRKLYNFNLTNLIYEDYDSGFRPLTPWTPNNISTSLWLDSSDTSTVNIDNSKVSGWLDKSSNNKDFQQTNIAKQPSLSTFNSLQSIRFELDENGTRLESLSSVSNPLGKTGDSINELFIWVAGQVNSLPTGAGFYPIISQTDLYGIVYSAGQILFKAGPDDQISTSNNVVSSGDSILLGFSASVSNNSREIWLNGTKLQSSSMSGSFSAASIMNIFGFTGNTNDNELGEIIIINGQIPSLETQMKIEGYLAHKWGINQHLPLNHLYKDSPPKF